MESTRQINNLSNAIDNAFATVILSPDVASFQQFEQYKEKLDDIISLIVKKHGISAFHKLPITQFTMSETVFKLYKIAAYMKEHYSVSGDVYITWRNNKIDIIYEHCQIWFSSGSDDFVIYQWYSLQDKIKPDRIVASTKSVKFPDKFKFLVRPKILKENPLFVMMLYDQSYVEVGELYSREQGNIELKEIRPLRSREAMNMVMNFRKLETMGLKIQPDPPAFTNVLYFQELSTFKVLWKPWTKKTIININKIDYPHSIHPDLVFHYEGNNLRVYLLKNNILYDVPYMNSSAGGSVCMGVNTTIQSGLLSDSLHRLEELFFHTMFTHVSNKKYSNEDHLDFVKGNYKEITFLKYKSLSDHLELKYKLPEINEEVFEE